MKQIKIKAGLLNVEETNLNKIIQDVIFSEGYPLLNSCCYTLNTKPTNGQVLSYDSITSKVTFKDNIPFTLTSQGQLLTSDSNNNVFILDRGNNGNVLTVNTSSIGASTLEWKTTRYSKSIISTDWALNGTDYILTIPASEHGRGIDPIVQTFELVGTDFNKNIAGVLVKANGDVVLYVNTPITNTFTGKIVIL